MQRLLAAMQVSIIVGGKNQTLGDLAALADRLHRLSRGVSRVEVAPAVDHPPCLEMPGYGAHKETRLPHITKTTTYSASTRKIAQQLTRWIGLTTRQTDIHGITSISTGRPGDVSRHADEKKPAQN